ncbi:MAG: dockerin type I domain-containing protein, partial [Ruminococcus sp.]
MNTKIKASKYFFKVISFLTAFSFTSCFIINNKAKADNISYSLADVNGDSEINASDASLVLNVYAILSSGGENPLTEEQQTVADVNNDGNINASDASAILSYYAYVSSGGTTAIEWNVKYSDSPTLEHIESGMYKVGVDIPAGEYCVYASEENISGYYCVSSDSTGSFESIVSNEIFQKNSFITVEEGQYLTLTGATACTANIANVDTSESGVFRIGYDIQAGEYALFSTDTLGGYYSVNSDSSGTFESIIGNDNFSYNAIITVSNGQYLKLNGAKAVPVSEASIDTSQSG